MISGVFGSEYGRTPGGVAAGAGDRLTTHGRRTERSVAGQVRQRNILALLGAAHTRNIDHIIATDDGTRILRPRWRIRHF